MNRARPRRPTFEGLTLRFGRIVIIEWLMPDDPTTGEALIKWMEQRGYHKTAGRKIQLYRPRTREDFLNTLATIATETTAGAPAPLIHIEAHGNTEEDPSGYWHRDEYGHESLLKWEELEPYLRAINLACRCNLLLLSAACWGHAAILAASTTHRVPFIACVGFGTSVIPGPLHEAVKEFYRQVLDGTGKHLGDAVDAAQRELGANGEIHFDVMQGLSYEAMEDNLRSVLTPDALRARALAIAMRSLGGGVPMLDRLPYSTALDRLHRDQAAGMQRIWDIRFMIDLYPENRERFGCDIDGLVTALLDEAQSPDGDEPRASASEA